MTATDLTNLYWEQKEVSNLMEQIETIKAKAERVTTSLSATKVKATRNLRAVEGYMTALAQLQDKAKNLISDCVDDYNKTMDWIKTINDSRTRQIISLRYISGYSWQQVANRLGGYETADSVRMVAARYIARNCEKV